MSFVRNGGAFAKSLAQSFLRLVVWKIPTIYVASLNEHRDMPDSLALRWNKYGAEHLVGNHNADAVHTEWFNSLTPQEQQQVARRKAKQ